jgi:hypothetical protein
MKKETIHVDKPDGTSVKVEVIKNMFFIGESMFLFTSLDNLIKIAKEHGKMDKSATNGTAKEGNETEEAQSARD